MERHPLVVAALGFEVAGLGWERFGLPIAVTGSGPIRAQAGMERALARHRPLRVLALGLCGGVAPDAPVGSLAVPTEIVSDRGLTPLANGMWPGLTQRGRLITVDRPVAEPRAKARLRDTVGADWVDMESYIWAEVARSHAVPLTVVRVVADTWNEWLPTWRRISSWPAAVSLPFNSFRARRELHRVARRLVCAC